VERVLRACQNLAPTGIFARSLAECLALQLEERGRLDLPMRTLLDNLERLAGGETASLAALCGVGRSGLDRLIAEIRTLDPKPGLAFTHEPVRTLIPDVFVRPGPNQTWIVELNDQVLPRLLVNSTYYALVSPRCSGADRTYMDECRDKAKWLKKSLDQRARTVLRVASEIVRRQEGFLSEGVAHLKPLNLRIVADALGIHESTVSRAAANKTIATPRGIFEFRYFFTGAIAATAGGEAHSAEAVKHRIRKMILEEAPDAVLSDDAIVAILSREGVDIARRTVAKYRELMRIGSSVERRREKRLKAAS
jgi:RNA polymerase sigma-54 factor